ncbi:molybdopterin cofactor-binding domain-containing protein [Hartmannibacter diazotrophicus]|uniref:molybdopterin cofactor-binding domain-containing protein n=1 Tax=Hartmannibacter diazotrophicus TaxID=1482074 RepID=UPI000C162623|nr:molybdopterin cofactor-binding domain-containing protein [Hartmannibacter diazotrophicus]
MAAAAGRIVNEKTAASQCYGGQIRGIGGALMEGLDIDPRSRLIVKHDPAHYHAPANADAGALDVVFLPERDGLASPQAKAGIGRWATFQNHQRPHAAHGGQPPAMVYFNQFETGQQAQRVA